MIFKQVHSDIQNMVRPVHFHNFLRSLYKYLTLDLIKLHYFTDYKTKFLVDCIHWYSHNACSTVSLFRINFSRCTVLFICNTILGRNRILPMCALTSEMNSAPLSSRAGIRKFRKVIINHTWKN